MARIRTLIVDDEPLAREGVRVLLKKDPEIEIIGEAGKGADAVRAIEHHSPELLFLDVQMPEMNGFDVLRRVKTERMPLVIFVTAYDAYALRAFEVHALDYLLKPFDDERFFKALQRAKAQLEQQQAHALSRKIAALVQDYDSNGSSRGTVEPEEEPRHLTRLVIKSAGRVVFLRTEEIDWIEAADYYVKLHAGGKSHLLRETMAHLEERLDPSKFLRIHRSTIVNLDRVKELRSRINGENLVCLADGTQLRLSRSRREHLDALLHRHAN